MSTGTVKRLLAIAILLVCTPQAWAVVADNADDICAPAANPCVVTQDYDIVDGSTLDFGTRTLQVSGNGVLDTNDGDATVLCGSFTTDSGTVAALKVRGLSGGVNEGGSLTIEARQRCTLDNNRTCISDVNCNFGTCTLKVCSEDQNQTCSTDANCDFGTCSTNKCTGNTNLACQNDGDCKFGTCTVDVCLRNKTLQCGTDDDCNFGTCSEGVATFETLRPILGNGVTAGSLFVRAAGDITIGAAVTFNTTSPSDDGGIVDIESGTGSITINGVIEAKGGGTGTGGEICLISGEDITINAAVDASGGDFDGGFVEFDAARNVLLTQPVRANSNNGGGFGGEVAIAAANDLTANAPATVEANGHFASVGNFGGDGGSVELAADHNVNVASTVLLTADGAAPDGFGGEVLLESGAQTTLAGTASAKTASDALEGAGGNIDVDAGTGFIFPAAGLMDARGAANGGGAVNIVTDGPMTFGGTIDARTTNNGEGDFIDIDIGGDVTMTGTVRISGVAAGESNGDVDFEFCRLTMKSTALIDNVGAFGQNTLRARERLTMESGSKMQANVSTGLNRIIYRDPAKPPVLSGTVTPPAAANDINPELAGCPVCGNNELDGGETCEDGNTNNGDGCSSDCQDEACIAQTPGYNPPDVPLCDDADGCTEDTCVSSTCQHETTCDDGIDCTNDSCNAQNECQNLVDDTACDDDNPCTQDICSVGAKGCVSVPNTSTCDDGKACTVNDHCGQGVCAGTEQCPVGESCNPTTGECGSGGGECGNGNIDGNEQCDDGDTQWSPGEGCDATCMLVLCGDPDDSGTFRSNDALTVLRTAVALQTCDSCVCNVDSSTGSNPINAGDSLRVLRKAVGLEVELICPACS